MVVHGPEALVALRIVQFVSSVELSIHDKFTIGLEGLIVVIVASLCISHRSHNMPQNFLKFIKFSPKYL
jgi:hypothetical protein